MGTLYNEILYRPLLNAVIFLYNFLPGNDFGLAIIVLTIIIRIILFPLTVKTIRSQRALSQINPRIKEIKEKFKENVSAQSAAIMQLYKENNINPLSGCLPLLVQIPLLIALYQAFGAGFKPENLNLLYGFIANPVQIQNISFRFLDITAKSSVLALITGVFQYIQLKQNQFITQSSPAVSDPNMNMQALNKQMLYFFPVMIIIIGWNLPAGLLLYWLTTTIFSMAEQSYIRLRYK